MVEVRGRRVADAVIEVAAAEGATEIIIGTSSRGWWDRLWRGSIADQLMRKAPHLALHVMPLVHEEEPKPAKEAAPGTYLLSEYLKPDNILPGLRNVAKIEQAITMLVDQLAQADPDLRDKRRALVEAVLQRERLDSTFLETGIAIPHAASVEDITDVQAVLGLFPDGLASGRDGQKAYLVLLFLSPLVGRSLHMKFLQRIARVFGDATTVRELAACKTGAEAHERLRAIESHLR